jgi:DNA-binding NarL/FixJ family response regulator
MLAAGIAGFVLRVEPVSLVVHAIETAAEGGTWLSRQVLAVLADQEEAAPADALAQGLTERERQVLVLLARGESGKGIAKHLGVSERTVRFHLRNLQEKLAIGTRGELIAWAARELPFSDGE